MSATGVEGCYVLYFVSVYPCIIKIDGTNLFINSYKTRNTIYFLIHIFFSFKMCLYVACNEVSSDLGRFFVLHIVFVVIIIDKRKKS